MDIRASIREALLRTFNTLDAGIGSKDVPLEYPAELPHGDYSSGVALRYAKQMGMSPRTLAEKILEGLGEIEGVSKVEIAGAGFINFFLSAQEVASTIEDARASERWGANTLYGRMRVVIDHTQPNPFKPFHIGHLMSNTIGESVSRLFEYSGASVHRVNYQGDIGPHVAKCLWGVMKNGLDPSDVKDLGDAYVQGTQAYENNPKAKEEIDHINQRLYAKDPELQDIYSRGRTASLEHFGKLYEILGSEFERLFFESETGPLGVGIVEKRPGVFEQSEGAIVFHGEKYGLHTRVFITAKGTPTYEAKELGLVELKQKEFPFDLSIVTTATEQNGFFEVIEHVVALLWPELKGKYTHVAHGMMRFAEGKMSSRKGNVITGESLLAELTERARERAKESRSEDVSKLAEQVAVAAIKYQVLKQQSGKDVIFNREQALSLEGDSGPYIQYTYARASAVLEKAKSAGVEAKIDERIAPSDLARLVRRFPEIVERAALHREPHFVTTHILEIASAFNRWYAEEQIVDGSTSSPHKVALTAAVQRTLKNGLWLLGIPAPERM